MASNNDYRSPIVLYEQIDIPATGLMRTNQSVWGNGSKYPIEIEKLMIDANSVTTASIRFGVRGQRPIRDFFVDIRALQNYPSTIPRTNDANWPLWKFKRQVYVPPKQEFQIELVDLTDEGVARVCTPSMNGYLLCDPSIPDWLTETVSIPAGGKAVARLISDDKYPTILTDFGLWINESGSAAHLRGISVKVSGGGMPAWTTEAVRGSALFPDVNPVAAVWKPSVPIVLNPGETFEAEFRDTSGAAKTVYFGAVGSTPNRRS